MSSLAITKDELAWNHVEGMARYARARRAVANVRPNDPPKPVPPKVIHVPKPILVAPVAAPKKEAHPLACKRYPSPICGPCQPHHVAFSYYQYEETITPVAIVSIEDCIRYACVTYNFTRQEMIGPQRHASLVLARHVAMYLAKKYTAKSLPEIGRRIGHRDHTTILHGIRRMTKEIKAGKWSLPPIEKVLSV